MTRDEIARIEKRANSAMATEAELRSDIARLADALRWHMDRKLRYLTSDEVRLLDEGCHGQGGGPFIGGGGLFL